MRISHGGRDMARELEEKLSTHLWAHRGSRKSILEVGQSMNFKLACSGTLPPARLQQHYQLRTKYSDTQRVWETFLIPRTTTSTRESGPDCLPSSSSCGVQPLPQIQSESQKCHLAQGLLGIEETWLSGALPPTSGLYYYSDSAREHDSTKLSTNPSKVLSLIASRQREGRFRVEKVLRVKPLSHQEGGMLHPSASCPMRGSCLTAGSGITPQKSFSFLILNLSELARGLAFLSDY